MIFLSSKLYVPFFIFYYYLTSNLYINLNLNKIKINQKNKKNDFYFNLKK